MSVDFKYVAPVEDDEFSPFDPDSEVTFGYNTVQMFIDKDTEPTTTEEDTTPYTEQSSSDIYDADGRAQLNKMC